MLIGTKSTSPNIMTSGKENLSSLAAVCVADFRHKERKPSCRVSLSDSSGIDDAKQIQL